MVNKQRNGKIKLMSEAKTLLGYEFADQLLNLPQFKIANTLIPPINDNQEVTYTDSQIHLDNHSFHRSKNMHLEKNTDEHVKKHQRI